MKASMMELFFATEWDIGNGWIEFHRKKIFGGADTEVGVRRCSSK